MVCVDAHCLVELVVDLGQEAYLSCKVLLSHILIGLKCVVEVFQAACRKISQAKLLLHVQVAELAVLVRRYLVFVHGRVQIQELELKRSGYALITDLEMGHTRIHILVRGDTRRHKHVVEVELGARRVFHVNHVGGGVVAKVSVVIMTHNFDHDFGGIVTENLEELFVPTVFPHFDALPPTPRIPMPRQNKLPPLLSTLQLTSQPRHLLISFFIPFTLIRILNVVHGVIR